MVILSVGGEQGKEEEDELLASLEEAGAVGARGWLLLPSFISFLIFCDEFSMQADSAKVLGRHCCASKVPAGIGSEH